jgi:hypothetical protein
MTRVSTVILVVVIGLPVVGTVQDMAWWVTWSIRPIANAVEGIPVGTLDPSWHRASLINLDDLPIASTKPGDRLEDSGVSLSHEADLDGDGQSERAVVGVFETARGERGRFLLILGRAGAAQAWRKRAVFQVKGGSMFSALAMRRGTLTWYGCLECDDECAVVSISGEFRLRCSGQ